MNKNINNIRNILKNRWLISFAVGFFVFAVLLSGIVAAYEFYYQDKIYNGVAINNIDISGKTKMESLDELRKTTDQFLRQGLFFKYKNKEVVINPVIVSPSDLGLINEILIFDLEKAVNQAYAVGRNKGLLFNLTEQLKVLLNKKHIEADYELDREELKNILISNFSSLENQGEDAKFDIKTVRGKIKVMSVPERLGKSFDYDLAIQQMENNLKLFSISSVEMYMGTDYPEIKRAQIEAEIPKIKSLFKIFPLKLIYRCDIKGESASLCDLEKKEFEIQAKLFADWVEAKIDNNFINIKINHNKIASYLKEVAKEVDIQAKDAKFKLENNRVVEFQKSIDGVMLNIEKSINNIEDSILNNSTSTADLVIETAIAKNNVGDINDLGVKKLIGTGSSNFSGSPKNRRHNIAVGAKTINGILIKPKEEFSLVGGLGKIDANAGYLQELVIKGNKTVPEYGGGLCQIATTIFRVALDAGLPIIERRPHAYRVSYYEPAGTDATIYSPRPDVKFINDTDSYILVQTDIQEDELIFEFWGDTGGREVEITEPKIFNIVSPGPTKFIETEDLDPGKKKCTESSHNGADAEFTRKIIYSDGEIKEEIWKSHYRPWRAVCLIGKEIEEETEDGEKDTEDGEKDDGKIE
ncbi:MAG: VanW family protein [Patescibacteria group bacterium]|nr:VanW family protein [Patescibacteria group bacterium]